MGLLWRIPSFELVHILHTWCLGGRPGGKCLPSSITEKSQDAQTCHMPRMSEQTPRSSPEGEIPTGKSLGSPETTLQTPGYYEVVFGPNSGDSLDFFGGRWRFACGLGMLSTGTLQHRSHDKFMSSWQCSMQCHKQSHCSLFIQTCQIIFFSLLLVPRSIVLDRDVKLLIE